MSFFYRKSKSFGPVRLTASKRGLSVSTGIRGARITKGPSGTHLTLSYHGFQYRTRLDAPPAPQAAPAEHVGTAVTFALLTSESLAEFARLFRASLAARRYLWLALPGVVISLALIPRETPLLPLPILIIGVVVCVLVGRADRRRRSVHLNVEASDETRHALAAFAAAIEPIASTKRAWHVTAKQGSNYSRDAATIRIGLPRWTTSELRALCIETTIGAKLYLFPDRLLIMKGKDVGAIAPSELRLSIAPIDFTEPSAPPPDAVQIGTSYEHSKKDGSPDRRYSSNRALPILRYADLRLTTATGLDERFLFSSVDAATRLAAVVQSLGGVA
jgi:hypothetical protein